MQPHERIFVAGSDTLIGAAIVRQLCEQGYSDICGADAADAVDLGDARAVDAFFRERRPAYVFVASGKSGGIAANQKYPAELMRDNLAGTLNLVHAAHVHGCAKLLYLASSCSYPRMCRQPMQVQDLMTGLLEPTNEAYATAKLAGLKLCQAYRQQYASPFIVGIPANAFGLEDDFSEEDSHVIGALIRRMHAARQSGAPSVTVWGSGRARREFIFADDLARACIFVMNRYDDAAPINLGGGADVSIAELAWQVRDVVGYRGEIVFDAARPDGMPLKALDGNVLSSMGWKPQVSLREALAATYGAYLRQVSAPSGPAPRPAESRGSANE